MDKSMNHDIFINSYPNNKIASIDIKLESQNPFIFTKPPFPPMINVDEIIKKRSNKQNKKFTKTPNAFIIYRNAYIDQIHLHGIRLNMVNISSIVSMLWNQEPFYVKEAYKQLERDHITESLHEIKNDQINDFYEVSDNIIPHFECNNDDNNLTIENTFDINSYHEMMSNWHRELSKYNISPYQSYEDSMNVPFFNTHLV
ncbi:780_t:CDS:2 [Cetraspora pellucida]|uniref:780_t:CDS:1 n=1 Tax=Cetraspora pellucida TaxID=1433469 RepID=A0A9N9K253_9GLOM|nr:780_t:CDS:2 [Cetraspora pellucida]